MDLEKRLIAKCIWMYACLSHAAIKQVAKYALIDNLLPIYVHTNTHTLAFTLPIRVIASTERKQKLKVTRMDCTLSSEQQSPPHTHTHAYTQHTHTYISIKFTTLMD